MYKTANKVNMMNEIHTKILKEIENCKTILFDIFGKTDKFTISDLEKYVKVRYGTKIYDSLRELYLIEDGVIRAENAHYYVDACDIDIRNNAYKVFRVYEKSVNNEKHKYTLVYFTYRDEFIEDLFIETAGIVEDDIALYLFPKDGEAKLKRQLESLYREYTKDEWVNTLRMLGVEEEFIDETVKSKYENDKSN